MIADACYYALRSCASLCSKHQSLKSNGLSAFEAGRHSAQAVAFIQDLRIPDAQSLPSVWG